MRKADIGKRISTIKHNASATHSKAVDEILEKLKAKKKAA